MKQIALLLVGALCALVVVESAGSDGGVTAGAKTAPGTTMKRVPVHLDRAATGKANRPKITYWYTNPFPIAANGYKGVSTTCPRGTKVIDGGFETDGGIVADFLAPMSSRKYGYGLQDLSGQSGKIVLDIICSAGNG